MLAFLVACTIVTRPPVPPPPVVPIPPTPGQIKHAQPPPLPAVVRPPAPIDTNCS